MSVAFFDFDKTLIRKNSGALWLQHEVAHGNVSKLEALRAAWWLVQYSLGFADLDAAVRSAIRSIAGDREAEMRTRVHAWYAADVRHLYRPRARQRVRQHQDDGHRVVLLTSASNYVSEVVADELGLDGYLCNRFEVDEAGVYTGEPLGTLCFGPGKLTLAQDYLRGSGVDVSECWFYTDSMADVAMMEAVRHPVAVNPDPRLGRHARARGWAIEDWEG